jgi:histidinol phosphatase-like enzyme
MDGTMIYCFDLDGTLCEVTDTGEYGCTGGYEEAVPNQDAIEKVNALYDAGHRIIIDTARGSVTRVDWHETTRQQLERWGVKHHLLRTGTKIPADVYVDDRAINVKDWLNEETR